MPSSYNIGERYEGLIRQLVGSGRYASASEVVRDALRLMEEREEQRQVHLEALRDAIRDGMESGDPIPAAEVFRDLMAKYPESQKG